MTASYAVGRAAIAECDRCARRYLLQELKNQIVNQKKTELLVCPECLDIDHEQYQLGKTPVFDPQALKNPRPDRRTDVTNSPQLTTIYGSFGVPTFNTTVTPPVCALLSPGFAPTNRRG